MNVERAEHQAELFRDLVVEGGESDLSALLAKLRAAGSDRWARDNEAEEWYGSEVLDEGPLVFSSVASSLPRAALWVFQQPGSIHVSNIVPRDKSSLSCAEYNELIASFAEECLGPVVEEVGGSLRVLPGPSKRNLEDLLSLESAKALRAFSTCANKSTGKAHPYDGDRWNAFVLAAYNEDSNLDAGFLREWLLADGWDDDHADRLADSYSDQIEILRHRSPVLSTTGAPSDWVAALTRLRNLDAVIVLDTCAVLDVLQLPTRCEAVVAERLLSAVSALLKAAQTAVPRFGFVAPAVLADEVARNEQRVRGEVEAQVKGANGLIQTLAACAVTLGAELQGPPPHEATMRLLAMLGDIVTALRGAWISVPVTADVRHAAYERSSRGRPPASRGKDAIVDCAVAEVALHLARELPASRTKVILLSSNTKDFAQVGFKDELAAGGVDYCSSWEHAQHVALGSGTR